MRPRLLEGTSHRGDKRGRAHWDVLLVSQNWHPERRRSVLQCRGTPSPVSVKGQRRTAQHLSVTRVSWRKVTNAPITRRKSRRMRAPGQPGGAGPRRSGPSAHAYFLATRAAGLGQRAWGSGPGAAGGAGRGAGLFSRGGAGPSRGSGWSPAQARSEAGRRWGHGCGAKQPAFAASAHPPVGSEAREPGPPCRACSRIQMLKFKKVSLLGWSDGGITSLIAAAKYPSFISKMVIWGANAYVTNEDEKIYQGIRDVSKWSEKIRKPLETLYGYDYFAKTCEKWVDGIKQFKHLPDGNICGHLLPLVQCPTLIVHGEKDPLVPRSHADFIHKHVRGSQLHLIREGKHNLHLHFADEFNKLVEDFLQGKGP
uniref:Valacyclovir hydrolase isoform X1 n=1 Tax=Callorhinus ursinus TaxID=34884 RepID=A0A3Q7QX84_CALUR|nr:valacyclovir hydrolase isoform X1 [Callorhinus ursinus]